MSWGPWSSLLRKLIIPQTAGPNDPRVVIGGDDPTLAAIGQEAGVIWYWTETAAYAISVEKSGTRGQLHMFVAINGILAEQIFDVDYDTNTGDATFAFGVPVYAGHGLHLGSANPVNNSQAAGQSVTLGTYAASPVRCGVAFVAPPSGAVTVLWNVEQVNGVSPAFALTSFEIRLGAVVGSGTVVQAASDDITIRNDTTAVARSGCSEVVEGLTAGTAYNVEQMHRRSTGTATVSRRSVIVLPNL